ncbi:MAG: peptidase C13 [Hyphomonadaceae bacterium]|nr:peptidase C13 [Hyphomonadaceae bacterium]
MMRLAAACLALFLTIAATASAQVAGSPSGMIAISPREELAQHQRMEQAFAALQPQRRGVVDTYVLSVGFWDEHVFQHEAEGAAAVLGQRFSAAGRTLILTNGEGPGTPRTYPGARPYQLASAIGRLGEVMDRNEDVLVLFMTSHGNPDGSMAIQEQMRTRFALRPQYLREALDEAGIKNRLVIVSSCFSGAFIPALQNENTIILTAAAYDRTSFGCQPERDWTYFGEAFINQSMRQNRPLLDAFSTAKMLIESWEARDNVRPSLPNASVGAQTQVIQGAMTGRVR